MGEMSLPNLDLYRLLWIIMYILTREFEVYIHVSPVGTF